MKNIKGYVEALVESRAQRALDDALIDDIVDGDLKGCMQLLENGADPNAKSTKPLLRKGEFDYNLEVIGYTAIQVAILKMNFEIFKLLLSYGADPSVRPPDGSTTLVFTLNIMRRAYADISYNSDNSMIIRLLLRSGLNVKETCRYGAWTGITPLHVTSTMLGDVSRIIRLFIEKGADPNAVATYNGGTGKSVSKTPLSWLISDLSGVGPTQGVINNVKELIKGGANPFLSFKTPDDIIKFFGGDISWMPEHLRRNIERAQKVKGVFGK